MKKIPSRDERGNYVNDKGVVIKVSEYGMKVDFYDKVPLIQIISQYIHT